MDYGIQKTAFESYVKPGTSLGEQMQGVNNFVHNFYRDLGVSESATGRLVYNPDLGNGKRAASPYEFSIRGLAESLVSREWAEGLMANQNTPGRIFEAGSAPAMTPGNIPNVSAFLGSVAGLLDAAILQSYDLPEFKIDSLIPTKPSKTRQRVMIGLGRIGDASLRRNPGEPHQFAQFEERKTITSETYSDALACAVTFEAVYYDQTGNVLDQANTVGRELALRKELDGYRLIAGINNPYNYRGVAYNTYGTSGYWVNDVANELHDWTNINVVEAMFSRMKDQETGNRVAIEWDTVLCSPTKFRTAQYIQSATEVKSRTQSGTVTSTAPKLGDEYTLVKSVYMDQVLTDAVADGGAGLTQAQADEYWWALKTDKQRSAFVRTENWPVVINRAAPNDFTMLNHKLLLAVFADQRHSFDVQDPRYVIRNKNQ